MPVGKFIVGVAALIYDEDDEKYLLLRRSAHRDAGAGLWECPTGRLNQGEGLEEALIREVREEIRVEARPLYLLGSMHFYRGEPVPENELIMAIFACRVDDVGAIRIGEEHDEARWMTRAEAEAFLHERHWLRWVIDRAERMRSGVSPDLQAVFLKEGFEPGRFNRGG